MNRDQKIYGTSIVLIAVLFFLSRSLEIARINDLFITVLVMGVIGLGGKFVRDNKIAEKLSSLKKGQSSGSQYSFTECKEIAVDWAKKNYSNRLDKRKGVSFDWTQASSEPVPVYDFANQEWLTIRYFYTTHGPKNKGALIFVDATNGEVYASKPVKKFGQKTNPFNHLKSYRMTKRRLPSIGAMENGEDISKYPESGKGVPITIPYQDVENSQDGG